jgi:general secretion pathway protein L
MILDIGARSSDVLVLRGGEAVFARTVSSGTVGMPDSAGRLVRDLRTTVAAYRATGGPAPSRIYVCGGGAYLSGAEAFLSKEVGPSELLPLPQLDMTAIPPDDLGLFAKYAKAVGLAMALTGRAAGMNLRKGPLAYERGYGWVKEKIAVLSGLSAAILVSFMFTAWAELHAASKEKETLEKALGTVTQDVLGEQTTSAARAQELIAQQTTLSDEDPLPHADAFDVMVLLSSDIPSNITHDIEELDFQKAHVSLHGIVGSVAEAQQIQSTLKNERCLPDVKITRTNQVVGGERQKYVMEFDVKCPEDVKGKRPAASSAASASPSDPALTGGK